MMKERRKPVNRNIDLPNKKAGAHGSANDTPRKMNGIAPKTQEITDERHLRRSACVLSEEHHGPSSGREGACASR
jgi:hypothetical protein